MIKTTQDSTFKTYLLSLNEKLQTFTVPVSDAVAQHHYTMHHQDQDHTLDSRRLNGQNALSFLDAIVITKTGESMLPGDIDDILDAVETLASAIYNGATPATRDHVEEQLRDCLAEKVCDTHVATQYARTIAKFSYESYRQTGGTSIPVISNAKI